MLQRFSIWIDKKTLTSLKAIGKEKERPVGWIMRKAIEEFVENSKKAEKRAAPQRNSRKRLQ